MTLSPVNSFSYVIEFQDILARMQWKYAVAILITGIFLLIYVLWNNFVRSPDSKIDIHYIHNNLKIEPIIESPRSVMISQEFDMLAIMPALFLVIVGMSYFTGFEGVDSNINVLLQTFSILILIVLALIGLLKVTGTKTKDFLDAMILQEGQDGK